MGGCDTGLLYIYSDQYGILSAVGLPLGGKQNIGIGGYYGVNKELISKNYDPSRAEKFFK